jgi:hypothetical protein
MSALTEFAETFAAAARWHGVQKKHRVLLHERLLPALARTAEWDDAAGVAHITKQIATLVKHPDTYYSETVKMTGGVRLG